MVAKRGDRSRRDVLEDVRRELPRVTFGHHHARRSQDAVQVHDYSRDGVGFPLVRSVGSPIRLRLQVRVQELVHAIGDDLDERAHRVAFRRVERSPALVRLARPGVQIRAVTGRAVTGRRRRPGRPRPGRLAERDANGARLQRRRDAVEVLRIPDELHGVRLLEPRPAPHPRRELASQRLDALATLRARGVGSVRTVTVRVEGPDLRRKVVGERLEVLRRARALPVRRWAEPLERARVQSLVDGVPREEVDVPGSRARDARGNFQTFQMVQFVTRRVPFVVVVVVVSVRAVPPSAQGGGGGDHGVVRGSRHRRVVGD